MVEQSVALLDLAIPDPNVPFGLGETLHWTHGYGGVPSYPAGTLEAGETPTFRLLKLHGSINWYWVAGDTSGTTLQHGNLVDTPTVAHVLGSSVAAPARTWFGVIDDVRLYEKPIVGYPYPLP